MDGRMVATERGDIHLLESGPEDGTPVVLIHGNLSTGRYFEHVMAAAPAHLRLLAPDIRGARSGTRATPAT